MRRSTVLAMLALALSTSASPVEAAERGELPTDPLAMPMLAGLWFYRNVISPLDGARCPMYPTCAAYATEAVRRHGPLVGGWLAADRLLHEAGSYDLPRIDRFGRTWIHDPVDANDAIFRRGVDGGEDSGRAGPDDPGIESDVAPGSPTASVADRSPPAQAPGSPPGGAPEARAMGEALARRGAFDDAVTELRRAAFLTRDPAAAGSALEGAAWTAARGGAGAQAAGRATEADAAFDDADRLFEEAERAAETAGDREAAGRAARGRALALLARGFDREAERRLLLQDEGEARWLAAFAGASVDLREGRSVRAAASRFAGFTSDPRRGPVARELLADAAGEDVRWRSPRTAAVLSLLVPGAGHVYAGRPLQGVGALMLNGLFIGGAIWAVRERNIPLAIVLLEFESGWYFFGANGAAQAAADRNEEARRRIDRRWRRRFMGAIGPDGAAAAWLF